MLMKNMNLPSLELTYCSWSSIPYLPDILADIRCRKVDILRLQRHAYAQLIPRHVQTLIPRLIFHIPLLSCRIHF